MLFVLSQVRIQRSKVQFFVGTQNFFSVPHMCDKKKNIFLYFFTELKTHLFLNSIYTNSYWCQNEIFKQSHVLFHFFLGGVKFCKPVFIFLVFYSLSKSETHDPYYYTRRVKQAIHTRLHHNNINRDSGIEIPEAWMPTIKKHNNRRAMWQGTAEGANHRSARIEMHQSEL